MIIIISSSKTGGAVPYIDESTKGLWTAGSNPLVDLDTLADFDRLRIS